MSQRLAKLVLFVSAAAFTQPAAAVNLLYDFEGDAGITVIDKLVADGSHDGTIINNVFFDSIGAPFGTQAARFEPPNTLGQVPPFSTLEIPDTTFGSDFSLTVAMHVDNQESTLGFTRLFSSYRGTGPVDVDRILLDYDPTGGVIPGLRAIVNNTVVQTGSPPDGITVAGYHHYAMTIDNGDVSIFFDGSEVANGNVGFGYSSDANLHIGEDPHDGGGTADEQLIGNFDEVLVIERALSSGEIGLLAGGNPVPSVVAPLANERAVYYNFEGDIGTTITDKFVDDGAQDGISHRLVGVDTDPVNAKLGSASAGIRHPGTGSIFSQIDIGPVGNLGSQFTLSAVVNVPGGGHPNGGLTRLFSSFRGTGPIQPEELIFDFDPFASVADIGMRLVLPDGSQVRSPVTFSVDENHTLTAVYDNGNVTLYLDGEAVDDGAADIMGDVDLGSTSLKIGEDNGGILNENFVGTMDDVLILGAALGGPQVAELARVGAAAFLGVGGLPGDFDNNGTLDVLDINALVGEIIAKTNDGTFDLTSDGIVNGDDLGAWRQIGGDANGFDAAYLEGDSDLDGNVNATDLNAMALSWQQSPNTWSGGDFDASGQVNAGDLNLVGLSWQQAIGAPIAIVPEPSTTALGMFVAIGLAIVRSHRKTCVSRATRSSHSVLSVRWPSEAVGFGRLRRANLQEQLTRST